MANKFTVSQADFQAEAAFSHPEFSLFRDTNSFLDVLFKALQRHGARLADLKVETGGGTAADFNVVCYLFNYWVTLRVRVDRIEILGSQMPEEYVEKYRAAIVDTLLTTRNYHQNLKYRTYTLNIGMHGSLEGTSVQEYTSRFVRNVPAGLGPSAGTGAVMYFGPLGQRLLSSVIIDRSSAVPSGLFCRTYVVWDGTKVESEDLPELADRFVRDALGQVGLQLPA